MQFVIFNPWKVKWNWIAFYQNSFVLLPGLLYYLIRRHTGRLANEAFTSNPIVSLKQKLSGLKITNCIFVKNLWSATETTKLKIWLEKTLHACANEEGGTNFLGELMYYRARHSQTNLENVVLRERLVDKNDWQHYIYQADECALHIYTSVFSPNNVKNQEYFK